MTDLFLPPVGSAESRRWDSRTAGGLLTVAGVLGLLAAPVTTSPWLLAGDSAVALVLGLAAALLPVRAGTWPRTLRSVLAAAVIAVAGYATRGSGGGIGALLTVWLVLHLVTFRRPREVWLVTALAVALDVGVLFLTLPASRALAASVATAVIIGSLAAAGAWLRGRLDTLLVGLRDQVEHDPLTGLYNRIGLDNHRGDVRCVDACVLLLDIDHFKSVNDRYGHLFGDHVLVELAAMLARSTGAAGFPVRLGGEEFLVWLPGVPLDEAVRLAEELREGSAHVPLPDGGRLTVSVGVAHGASADPSALLRGADRALYASKQAGRNRVTTGPAAQEGSNR